jgi:hypothetical protein
MPRPIVSDSSALVQPGQRYELWTVIGKQFRTKDDKGNLRYFVVCQCTCGTITAVDSSNLRGHLTKSCGCVTRVLLLKLSRTHGASKTPLYFTWKKMRARCSNRKLKEYKWYGGKGVRVTEKWAAFEAFRKWATRSGYKEGLTIDRIDSDGDYCPENCQWLTRAENARKGQLDLQRKKHARRRSDTPVA